MVVDGIHDGVGVQRAYRVALPVRLAAEQLGRGFHRALAAAGGVDREDRRAGEAEQVILFEMPDDGRVHIAELAAVAFIEDQHHMALVNRVGGIFLDEGGQLLDGGDDDFGRRIFQLAFEHGGGGIAVGSALLEAVVLLHGLVVQVFAVYHKQHFVDVGQLAGQPCCLEGGQRFAAAGGVPDVAAAPQSAVLFVSGGDLDAVQNLFGGGDLVRPHDHQHIFRGEHTVPGQQPQQGMLQKEGAGKIYQIGNDSVFGVGPEGGELKAVTCPGLFAAQVFCFADGVEPGGVGVVFGVGAIGDNEDLHILKQTAASPEGLPLVAIDLVEGFPDGYAPAFEFHMHQRQAVDQDGHVIAVVMAGALGLADLVLVDNLQAVFVDVLLVDQGDVFGTTVVPPQNLDEILLDLAGLFHNMLVGVGNGMGKELIPLAVGEGIIVEGFQLTAQVGDEFRLGVDGKVGIPLFGELPDEGFLQLRLALVSLRAGGRGGVLSQDGVLGGGSNEVVAVHCNTSPSNIVSV